MSANVRGTQATAAAADIARAASQANVFGFGRSAIEALIAKIPTLKETDLTRCSTQPARLAAEEQSPATVKHNPKPIPVKVPGRNAIESGEEVAASRPGFEQAAPTSAVLAVLAQAIPEIATAAQEYLAEAATFARAARQQQLQGAANG